MLVSPERAPDTLGVPFLTPRRATAPGTSRLVPVGRRCFHAGSERAPVTGTREVGRRRVDMLSDRADATRGPRPGNRVHGMRPWSPSPRRSAPPLSQRLGEGAGGEGGTCTGPHRDDFQTDGGARAWWRSRRASRQHDHDGEVGMARAGREMGPRPGAGHGAGRGAAGASTRRCVVTPLPDNARAPPILPRCLPGLRTRSRPAPGSRRAKSPDGEGRLPDLPDRSGSMDGSR
jgi:hypothetical protein